MEVGKNPQFHLRTEELDQSPFANPFHLVFKSHFIKAYKIFGDESKDNLISF